MDTQSIAAVQILGGIGVIVFVFWIIRNAVGSAIKDNRTQPTHAAPKPVRTEYAGPGDYEIVGVDRTTGEDKTWATPAVSRENAKVKAELQGLVVTRVTYKRQPTPSPAPPLPPAPPTPPVVQPKVQIPKPPKEWNDARLIRVSIACMVTIILLATIVIVVVRR